MCAFAIAAVSTDHDHAFGLNLARLSGNVRSTDQGRGSPMLALSTVVINLSLLITLGGGYRPQRIGPHGDIYYSSEVIPQQSCETMDATRAAKVMWTGTMRDETYVISIVRQQSTRLPISASSENTKARVATWSLVLPDMYTLCNKAAGSKFRGTISVKGRKTWRNLSTLSKQRTKARAKMEMSTIRQQTEIQTKTGVENG
ncbi:hypothetical protein EDD16DRAFT_1525779 [Pisolithus croceorrhizus]|nr:hypothetical protein EDD16DRAFT_1525779 [Pisolithus croceorrhizus]KAI6160347.1 hypothetical protein EDD17DRAFT_1510636 [Pisolithus thermaeus]